MANLDINDVPSFYMNSGAYSQVKDEKKTKSKGLRRTEFSRVLDDIRGETADELGPLRDLPVSQETLDALMDNVRSTGDDLLGRPFPDEILRYKQAVRSFMHYVVQNAYGLEHETGLPKFMMPGYSGKHATDEAKSKKRYTKIQVIDKKLEDMAAMILSGQVKQLELTSRLEEIRGLLIDLLQ
ncbi:MAG: YaaR family protein [Treponema sp.]|jgi:uncharacterized protein YaaR (DUF327 family)|nr:YaaR family protein [Treponema sp.]